MKLILSMLLCISFLKGAGKRDFTLSECKPLDETPNESLNKENKDFKALLESFYEELDRSKNNKYNPSESFVLKVAPTPQIDDIKKDSFLFREKNKKAFLLSFYLIERIENQNDKNNQNKKIEKIGKVINFAKLQNKLSEKFPNFVNKSFKCKMSLKTPNGSILERVLIISEIPNEQFIKYERIKALSKDLEVENESQNDEEFLHTISKLLYFVSKMHDDNQCFNKFSLDTILYDLDINSFIFTDFTSITKCGDNIVQEGDIYRSLVDIRRKKEEEYESTEAYLKADPKTDVLILSTIVYDLRRPNAIFDIKNRDITNWRLLYDSIDKDLNELAIENLKFPDNILNPISQILFQRKMNKKLYLNLIIGRMIILALDLKKNVTSEILSLMFLLVSSFSKMNLPNEDNAFGVKYHNLFQIINTLALNEDDKLLQDLKVIQFLTYGGFASNNLTSELLHQSILEILINWDVVFCIPEKMCNLRSPNNHKKITGASDKITGV